MPDTWLTPPEEPGIGWPDRRRGPWWVSIEFELTDDGEYLPVSIKVQHLDRAEPVTGALMRKLPVRELIDERATFEADRWRAMAEEAKAGRYPLPHPAQRRGEASDRAKELAALAKAWEASRPRTGRPRSDDRGPPHFAEVARVYLTAQANEATRNAPTAAVAAHFNVSHGTAGAWVSRARNDFPFIPKTRRGSTSLPVAQRKRGKTTTKSKTTRQTKGRKS